MAESTVSVQPSNDNADAVAEGIVRDLQPTSVLDAGFGEGALVRALTERGVETRGIDTSENETGSAGEVNRDRRRVASLVEPLSGRYDLIVSLGQLERVSAEQAREVLDNLCRSTDRLLLATSSQGFAEARVNALPPESLSAILAANGFFRDLERDFSYIAPGAALYVRREEPVAEMVRRYDRAWWRLQNESAEAPRLREELAARDQEILRLRDLLIGRDAELGEALGRLAALEQHTQRLAKAAARIPIPFVRRAVVAILSRLTG